MLSHFKTRFSFPLELVFNNLKEHTKNIENRIDLLIVFCNTFFNILFLINQPQLNIDYSAGWIIPIMLIELLIDSNNANFFLAV